MLTTATCKTGKFSYSSLKLQILTLYFVLPLMNMTTRKHLSPEYLTWISLAVKKTHFFPCCTWQVQRTSVHFAIVYTHSDKPILTSCIILCHLVFLYTSCTEYFKPPSKVIFSTVIINLATLLSTSLHTAVSITAPNFPGDTTLTCYRAQSSCSVSTV